MHFGKSRHRRLQIAGHDTRLHAFKPRDRLFELLFVRIVVENATQSILWRRAFQHSSTAERDHSLSARQGFYRSDAKIFLARHDVSAAARVEFP